MKFGIRNVFLTAAIASISLFGTAQADPIEESNLPFFDGEIAFVGLNIVVHGVPLLTTALPTGGTSIHDATGIDFNTDNFGVAFAIGDFAGVGPGTAVAFNDIVFGPTNPANPLWTISVIVDSVEMTYSFATEYFSHSAHNGILNVWAEGFISATGYQDTAANWAFSFTQAGDVLSTWSATTAVPEPGVLSTLALGLLALGFAGRRRRVSANQPS